VKSSVSIALFFLLSGFFLFALLAALQHSGKALAIAVVCVAAVVCIIVFLTPVRLPNWIPRLDKPGKGSTTTSVVTTTVSGSGEATGDLTTTTRPPTPTTPTAPASISTTLGGPVTSGAGQ
jgi:Kef-type K+ transport system membrane component KefB